MLLYIRTFLGMLVGLYTSRLILRFLGVDDYGIYQVVGGLVTMFSVISGALSSSISRFITFELGAGNKEKLHKIFSTSIIIQIVISVIIIILAEFIAIWFIQYKMTVPESQITATKWVLQFSLITFCIGLISVPYSAMIIAHEKMSFYAYISIVEVLLKLGVCYVLLITPFSRLLTYAVLVLLVALLLRSIYSIYCHKNFEECRGRIVFDKDLFKEMLSFSGWSFFTNSSSMVNNQGVTMLINVFFGLAVNAARGIASQLEAAVMQFVNNFTTAINPQITKSYASGDFEDMYALVCRGAKFSVFSMLVFVIPLILEMQQVLRLWLGSVPGYTVIFSQLALIIGIFDCMGNTAYTACMATGNIKKYVLIITPIGYLQFALAWVFFYFGAPAVTAYWIYIGIKAIINVIRIWLMRQLTGLPMKMYISKVYLPVISVGVTALVIPFCYYLLVEESVLRFIGTIFLSFFSVILSCYYLGMNKIERDIVKEKLINKIYMRFRK